MRTLFAAAVCSTVLLAGCLDVEYGLTLDRNLSGTADFDMTMDLDRLAYVSASMQKMFAGGGEPTAEEVAAAKEEIVAQMEEDDDFNEEEIRREIESDLPEGVRLLDVESREGESERGFGLQLAFDHIDRLTEMNIQAEETGEGGPSAEPFGDLRVVDEGGTILITNSPVNPVNDAMEGMPGMEEMMRSAFEGLRIAFTLQAPFEVVEHNATRVDGDRLVWEFDLASLSAPSETGPSDIRVRYRK